MYVKLKKYNNNTSTSTQIFLGFVMDCIYLSLNIMLGCLERGIKIANHGKTILYKVRIVMEACGGWTKTII